MKQQQAQVKQSKANEQKRKNKNKAKKQPKQSKINNPKQDILPIKNHNRSTGQLTHKAQMEPRRYKNTTQPNQESKQTEKQAKYIFHCCPFILSFTLSSSFLYLCFDLPLECLSLLHAFVFFFKISIYLTFRKKVSLPFFQKKKKKKSLCFSVIQCRPSNLLVITISRVSNQNGISLLYIIVKIYHSGRKPSI